MFQIRVKADFAAAHFLRDYHGKCENLHGHNYKVYAHVQGKNLDEGGMLMDFTELKRALREVCGRLDHTNLNEIDFFAQNPSAERIAMYIYEGIIELIPGLRKTSEASRTRLWAVDVFETDTSRARFMPD